MMKTREICERFIVTLSLPDSPKVLRMIAEYG